MMNFNRTRVVAIVAFVLLVVGRAWAVDTTRPAVVNVTVADEDGKPLAGVKIGLAIETFAGTVMPVDAGLVTDANGRAQVTRLAPAGGLVWDEQWSFEKDGCLPDRELVTLFPSALVDMPVRLETRRQTLIRVLGPDGRGVPGATVGTSYLSITPPPYMPLSTTEIHTSDSDGQCVWAHGLMSMGFAMSAGSRARWSPDVPAVTITLTQADMDELKKVRPPQPTWPLDGTLLLNDGTPAVGWYVADDAEMSGMNFGPLLQDYAASRLAPVDRSGKFHTSTHALGPLIVVSPEGIPLLYDIDPQSWEPGVRSLTLTLPPVKKVLRGKVVDDDGKPLAGLRVEAQSFLTDGVLWEFGTDSDTGGMLSSDGKFVGVKTDDQGQYAASFYGRGDAYVFQVLGGNGLVELKLPGTTVLPRYAPETMKDISVEFRDENGAPVDVACSIDPSDTYRRNVTDTHGVHFFVRKDVTKMTIDYDAQGHHSQTLLARGTGDEHVVATVNRDEPGKPLRGRVLDPAGDPVPGAILSASRDGYGPRGYAITDRLGHFEMPDIADTCQLEVESNRDLSAGIDGDLPGWTPPIEITAKTRQVDVRLEPVGSIRIQLPAGVTPPDWGIQLARASRTYINGEPPRLTFDAATHCLTNRWVVPGIYTLPDDALPQLGVMDHQQITVEGGEQTYLDWSWWKVPAWEKQSPQWRTVTVTADGKPLSGAQVSIFTDKWRPQWIRQWVDQWARGDATAKALAEHRLVAGGAASLDLLDGMKQDPILTPLIEQVDHDCEMNPLGSLEDVASDLSDDHGTIRFQGDPGRDYVAVAMVQGKWLGWRLFAMSTGDVTVELKPTRTLSIHLPAWTPPPDAGMDSYRSISLLLLGPSGIERRSVSAAVNLPLSSNVLRQIGEEFHRYNWSPGLYSATAFGPDSVDVSIDDLPVGSALELGSSPNVVAKMPAGPVIIEPGDGPQKLLLPANN